ncbi:pyruvate carboxylase [Cellulophaga lytica]|uniref:Pyruvate carboxylase n=1 Tax=Cellulophaga lytica (strain ATCC 23178 / DSM 7489 / JCM 8516 / NBRC 14961 / NCIMB 1423 / VKM B-1433 / Cy l20) TaxID=867900 RepID=F0RAK0_CELLC|nr:pyruvate carboxylase [Cellulophaga lytica]ADY28393.1 pyruvate carboxylase [Cellulophaga lytica DSM 7489]MDO6854671.1 pyruvate carboxylase [Cellulophaga lytica]WQG77429.1 pyruvate carboxylase [Cellulophaga lytica]SNQ44028.1 Pyruvate carboxylase [Cellulophaga lytica]
MKINKVLVANRGEIAIRIFRACVEIGIKTVGVYTYEDRYSLHRYKADECYQIGEDHEPLKPYLNIDAIIQVAKDNGVDAIHPGYGFLSENAEFAQKCADNDIIFVGPKVSVLKSLGDKITAKEVAVANNVPVIQSSDKDLTDVSIAIEEAKRIGYPIMLKAASGGGGRGMRVIRTQEELEKAFPEARRESLNAFGDDTVFLEKFVENPKHIEVQIVADTHGNMVHLYERDCSVQRRYQKVIEFAPSIGLPQETRDSLYKYAIDICKAVNYNNIGTVEFLVDDDGSIYFIEVNPRIQVEHTVTEMITNIDLVKAQLFIAGGYKLSDQQIKIQDQESVKINGYALQCRITTEDPANDFKPDYGVVTTYRSASGFGIRLDAGSIYQGVRISPFFDSMLVKVSAISRTLDGSCRKMRRALAEFRIRGVESNMAFLDNILKHQTFRDGKVTVNFIKNEPSLFEFVEPRNRANKLIEYLGETIVNGNPDVKKKDPNHVFSKPKVPSFEKMSSYPKGTKDLLTELGPEGFATWLKNEKKVHFTDTTMRDGHQSLLATRMRTIDMLKVAEGYAKNFPEIFSMEVWGGATFDVCLRFLQENPWERLALLRKSMPNVLLQMLLRGSNGVGYTAYPDNLIEKFVEQSWETGVDVFRIFDSLNWMKSIAPTIEHVRNRTGGLAEGSLCYTGDILDPKKTKYNLKYYIQLAKDIENAGAHILGVKDMAGLLKPNAAFELISALKSEINIPIHLHTHDTSSIQAAMYLKAIEAGVDVVDVALGGLSGLTSQPNFNSLVEMLRFHERENKLDTDKLAEYSNYWETVRNYYYTFESGLKSGTGEVYKHEIPGGQYSNLKGQAIALGLEDKFPEVTKMYGEVNQLFGDIVKVTPSSKVVGDMAQYMISNNLTVKDVLENGDSISFPQSVISFFKGDLGQPVGGFPKELQKIILKDQEAYTERPNAHLEPIDFDKEFKTFKRKFKKGMGRDLEITDFLSYKLYPKVFTDAYNNHVKYGNVMNIPTKNFFYGMEVGEEILVELDRGKNVLVSLMLKGEPDENGYVSIFFKINGQLRNVMVKDKAVKVIKAQNVKIDKDNPKEIGAPLQGLLSNVLVKKGQEVKKNQPLFVIEAMKMETTVTATAEGVVDKIQLTGGALVNSDDLVLVLK